MSDEEFDRVIIVPDVNQTVLIVKGEPGPRGVSGGSGDSPVTSVNGETGDVVIDVGTGLPADWTVPGTDGIEGEAGSSVLNMAENSSNLYLGSGEGGQEIDIAVAPGSALIGVRAGMGQPSLLLQLQDENGDPVFTIAPNGSLIAAAPQSSFALGDGTTGPELFLVNPTQGYTKLRAYDGNASLEVEAGTGQTNPLLVLRNENGDQSFDVNPEGDGFGVNLTGQGTGVVDLRSTGEVSSIRVDADAGQTDPLLELRDENGNARITASPGRMDILSSPGGDSRLVLTGDGVAGTDATLTVECDGGNDGIRLRVSGPSGTQQATITIAAEVGQTEPLVALNDENGNPVFFVDALGAITVASQDGSETGVFVTSGPAETRLYADPVKVYIRATAVAGQTDPLLELQDENGDPVFSVRQNGIITLVEGSFDVETGDIDAQTGNIHAGGLLNVDGTTILAGGVGLNGASPAAQHAAIPDATDAAETMAALNTLLAYLRLRGDIAA